MLKTKLHKAHHTLMGKMINFFNWELPLQYSSLKEEHLAVRNSGGLFDVSHMGEIVFKGNQALNAVQYLTSNNVKKLSAGKIQYSALLTENGCFVDDLLVYMIKENEFLLVVNSANKNKDLKWMQEKAKNFDTTIKDLSSSYTQIAIQGPNAEKLLAEFTPEDLSSISYYHFVEGKVSGVESIISRTGYTGEDGFEIYFKADEETACKLLLALVKKGEKYNIIPAGLGARDTLRLEAKMSLYGNDIDDSHTVLEADLRWILKFKKGDFIGKEALLKQKEEGIKRKLVGFEITERGIARPGYPVFINNKEVSTVTSGTYVPYLEKPIGLTYLPVDFTDIGTEFKVGIRNKTVSAKVVETPFYKRK